MTSQLMSNGGFRPLAAFLAPSLVNPDLADLQEVRARSRQPGAVKRGLGMLLREVTLVWPCTT